MRRARLYLAALDWLEGWLEDGGWRRADTDELAPLDGALISKSRRAARTVIREHPVALAELVGDVDRWWSIIDAKLAWCSAVAAGSRAAFDPLPHLPPRIVRALGDRGPLAMILATAWVHDHGKLARALAWLERTPALAQLAHVEHVRVAGFDRIALILARLALADPACEAGVAALIAALAIDAPEAHLVIEQTRNLEHRLLGQREQPARAAMRSGRRLIAWIEKLAARERPARQRALALIGVAGIADALAPWQAWERANAPLLARADELAGHDFDEWERAAHVTRVVDNVKAARKRAPQPVDLAGVILEIDMLAAAPFSRFHSSVVRLLAAIPATPPHARSRMLVHVARVVACADANEHFEWLWNALAAELERGAVAALSPWQPAIASENRIRFDSDLVEHAKDERDVQRVMRAIAKLPSPTGEDASRVATWLAAGLPEDALTALTVERVPMAQPVDLARAAIALSDGTPADISRIAKPLFDWAGDLHYHEVKSMVKLAEQLARTGAAWVARGALLANQRARLAEAAVILGSIAKPSQWPSLDHPTSAAWIGRYPEALQPALHRLATAADDAERVAATKLAADLPDPADLAREIAALRASGKAPVRLANLERRLASPRLPSAKRLANLADKLETAARELALSRLIAEATEISGARVIKMLGLPSWPAWAEPPDRAAAMRVREILFALLDLDHSARELAGRILRGRSGPPPWDLRGEPVNRAFLERMRAHGIEPGPWLETTPKTVDGIDLAFAADPLDVFAMGWHFDTCLSPRGGNFFSAVANAADINKRVLYARREGRVIGRCLFALTDGFALLTFQPYCHQRSIDFAGMVRAFAIELAARMGAPLVPRGHVRKLLAPDWYDDGPRDLVGRFEGLAEDFDFAAIPPEGLVARLREVLGRDLDDVTLPIVLGHANLKAHPRHLAPLVPFVLASSTPQLRIDAAQLAFHARELELADRLLGEHDRAIDLDALYPATEMLARLRPSSTLARLRASRSRDVRRWTDEYGHRIALAGMALEALARTRQAAAMYRLAARTEQWLVPHMRARLGRLGEPFEGEVAV